jgi:CxxC-x17-CxxC domain-containing protein
MKKFKGRNSFGDHGIGERFGERSFKKSPRERDVNGRGDMFPAVCANCSKACEVPFKPNGKKPVYCTNCFGAGAGGGAPRGNPFDNRFEKTFEKRVHDRDYRESIPARTSRPVDNKRAPSTDQLQREINSIGTKIDRVIEVLDRLARVAVVASELKPEKKATVDTAKKVVVKKVSVKKKAATKKK